MRRKPTRPGTGKREMVSRFWGSPLIALVFISTAIIGCSQSSDQSDDQQSSSTPTMTSQPTTVHEAVTPRLDVVSLEVRAEDQYQRADSIVNDTPSSATAAAEMVGGSDGLGGQFYDRDRALQSSINCVGLTSSNRRVACGDLAEAEEFEYSAVEASLAACNEHDARLNLRVARAFLDEVRRDLNGSSSTDWSPPDITNEVQDSNNCGE